ncbi:MAG: endonuclease/exonuclease/phosphatase family protein [Bacteroidota bacterium]
MKKVLFICFMFLFAFYSKAKTVDTDKTILRVLTFNILHGATMKGDFNLDLIADVILRTEADLVALQEVDFKTNRAKKYDLVLELAKLTGMVPLFGRAMFYDDGEYGEAILSKKTIINSRNVKLPHLNGYEPRTALEITIAASNEDTISFIGTHLDHVENDTNRIIQAKKINSVFEKKQYPTILAGDLNDVPGSRTINIFEKVWTLTCSNNPSATYPSENPNIKIDYVMVLDKERWNIIETKVIQDSLASDHCAYLAVLELK